MDAIDESLLTELRAALAPGADAATRRAGADACRALLAVLDPPASVPALAASPTSHIAVRPGPAAPTPTLPLTAPAASRPPPSQVLDMLIAHLRAKLPADQAPRPASSGFRVPMIPMRRSGGS